MHSRHIRLPENPARSGFTIIESLVVLGLVFVLSVLLVALYRYHEGGGAAKTKKEITPHVPGEVDDSTPPAVAPE